MIVRTRVPLRVSFCGGGSDVKSYYENNKGRILSATINKFVNISLITVQKGIVSFDDVQDFSLIIGVLNYYGLEDDIKITIKSDAPPGSGLGSSSSLIVGLMSAIKMFLEGNPEVNYEEAIMLEREFLCFPGGTQDQICAINGGINYIQYDDGKIYQNNILPQFINIDELESTMFLCYTGKARKSNIIESRINRTNEEYLNIMRNTVELTEKAYNALVNKKYREFYTCIHDSWSLKLKMSKKVSNPIIDEIIYIAMKNGAFAAKLIGAGGGGYILVCCPWARKYKLMEILEKVGGKCEEFLFTFKGVRSWII